MTERDMREELGFADEWYDDDEDYFLDDDDDDDDDEDYEEGLRPDWLHPDCRDVCSALDLGTCCKYPGGPLVRIAVDLADAAERAERGLGTVDCQQAGAELARCFWQIPGLLAQIHAVVPVLDQTLLAQLLCPLGTLAGALERACGGGCPWGCAQPALPDRRAEFAPLIELVAECSATVRVALGWVGGRRTEPIVVRSRRAPAPQDTGGD